MQCQPKTSRRRLCAIALCLVIQSGAYAQDNQIRVFKDEYVVEPGIAAASVGGFFSAVSGVESVRHLGNKQQLVRPRARQGAMAALSTTSPPANAGTAGVVPCSPWAIRITPNRYSAA